METDPTTIQPRISQELSDLADAALEGALAIARNEIEGSEHVRFTIIGMGKLGAQELNYVSDVDLIYVVEPADPDTNGMTLNRIGTKLATTLQRVCQSVIMGVAEPTLWQIDGGLRPEGKDGPLVRRLESHEAYYEQWAENWEFQALLKARPVAGDPELGKAYMDMTRPFVWTASKRDNFVYDCQQMRKRVEDLIPAPLKDREIKLGRGGLRDVEFTVQMLQLVHGRSDESLRTRSTLESLQALADGGYVSRKQAKKLSWDYRFERVMEHRQQMWALKRTHLFPDLGNAGLGGIERKRDVDVDALNRNLELRRLARAFHLHPEELVDKYDETRREVAMTWRNLRQQNAKREGIPNKSLADYIAPKFIDGKPSGIEDYIGIFAVTAGIGAEKKEAEFMAKLDDYNAIAFKSIADRLAEAFAEALHERVRKDLWGYASDEKFSNDELIAEAYTGIRPAPGYPSCPEHTIKREMFELMNCAEIGMFVTESLAMMPAASVSGFYFSHPKSDYFGIGNIDEDQLQDFIQRSGRDEAEVRRALAPLLG